MYKRLETEFIDVSVIQDVILKGGYLYHIYKSRDSDEQKSYFIDAAPGSIRIQFVTKSINDELARKTCKERLEMNHLTFLENLEYSK